MTIRMQGIWEPGRVAELLISYAESDIKYYAEDDRAWARDLAERITAQIEERMAARRDYHRNRNGHGSGRSA